MTGDATDKIQLGSLDETKGGIMLPYLFNTCILCVSLRVV